MTGTVTAARCSSPWPLAVTSHGQGRHWPRRAQASESQATVVRVTMPWTGTIRVNLRREGRRACGHVPSAAAGHPGRNGSVSATVLPVGPLQGLHSPELLHILTHCRPSHGRSRAITVTVGPALPPPLRLVTGFKSSQCRGGRAPAAADAPSAAAGSGSASARLGNSDAASPGPAGLAVVAALSQCCLPLIGAFAPARAYASRKAT